MTAMTERWQRWPAAARALGRAALGALLLVVAMSVVMVSVESLPRAARVLWPSAVAAAAMAAAYRFYARRIEHRAGNEFALAHAPMDVAIGLVGGAALVGCVFAALAALNVFHLQGRHPFGPAALGLVSEMVLVAFFEEILVRGIVLRALERPLGRAGAVVASALLFGIAHLPNPGATALSTLNVTMAGIMFGTAFVVTQRLWLCIALHLGWNVTAGYVFSATVSGHDPQPGLFFGELHGPGWLTGGSFGMEGSVVTLVALAVGTSLLLARAGTARPAR
jgi:membrane protease YdiL (CAAX protease family)